MKKILSMLFLAYAVSPLFAFAQNAGEIKGDLYLGLKNSEVLFLQQKLLEFGHFPSSIEPTGYFGNATKKAVIGFQKSKGVRPTGYVGPLTRKALMILIADQSILAKCLPADIKISDVVEAKMLSFNSDTGAYEIEKTLVSHKLKELGAKCSLGKLMGSSGKEVSFYRLTGCWGAPPPDYEEIMQKQREEISKLREKYDVIEITCNPSGIPIP
jgi:hypothetical protein